jgi:FAD/FMN-containing dehydrogenase
MAAATSLSDESIEQLRESLRGSLLLSADDGYDDARKLYNAMIDKHPAIIARCAGVADVTASVNFARSNDLPIAVRGGGHSVAGKSLCDGGLVVDLSAMRSVRVDPKQRSARAEGGATWADFDHETQAFGLATTGGIASTTGIGGLTLGGGIGYLNRKYGLVCDNLISADVVVADGTLLHASPSENEDLFWALRGGGANFGVVTSFEYQVHPVGPVLSGMLVWPQERAREVLRFYRDFSSSAPDELRLDAVMGTSPNGPIQAIVVCWCGPIDEGERALRPIREFGPPIMDTVAAVSYKTIQTLLESLGYVPGQYHYWKSSFFRELSGEAIDAITDSFLPAPTPLCAVSIEHLGGAIGRVAQNATAFAHRQAVHSFLSLGVGTDGRDSDAITRWARRIAEAVSPYLEDGVYVNYLGEGEGDERIRAAYGPNYERLAAVKAKYDPTNLFNSNQNIKPAVS